MENQRPGQTSNIQTELTENHYLVRYRVGPNQTGMRLDQFLKEHYRRRSRESIKRAIDTNAITIERKQSAHLSVGKLKSSTQVIEGDFVLVMSEKKAEPPVNFNYRVIYEDETLFVVDKPPNLPVHPSGRFFFHTLLIHLKTKYLRDANQTLPPGTPRTDILDNEEYFFLAHRIDKETSGILVLTKNSESCAHIVDQFAKRKTEKKYLAIAKGKPTESEFTIDLAMNRSPSSKILLKMECMSEEGGGLPSSTHFKVIETRGRAETGYFTLIECTPKTGRQHQIRVHLEAAGFPIVGDKLYGVDEEFALLFYERERLTPEAEARLLHPRHALHSNELKFTHPITGERLHFTSPLREDLQEFFDSLPRIT
jgi:23S rRNA pseudouridine1911/1915/1917 synthase